MTTPDFTSPTPDERRRVSDRSASFAVDDLAPALRRARHRHLRSALLAVLLAALLTVAGFLAGFVVASSIDDRPPCTRSLSNLPDDPDARPRAFVPMFDSDASTVSCDVADPLDMSPWTDAAERFERENG